MRHQRTENGETCSGAASYSQPPTRKGAIFKASLLVIPFLLVSFASALGAPAVEGKVIGADGKPLKGAQVRLERKDKSSAVIVTATDARGHYLVNGLSLGLYRISVAVDGAVKSALDVRTSERNIPVDFNLQASTGGKKVKRMVWVPASTYSHIGGRWVEEGTPEADGANVDRKKAEAAQEWMRHQTNPKQFP